MEALGEVGVHQEDQLGHAEAQGARPHQLQRFQHGWVVDVNLRTVQPGPAHGPDLREHVAGRTDDDPDRQRVHAQERCQDDGADNDPDVVDIGRHGRRPEDAERVEPGGHHRSNGQKHRRNEHQPGQPDLQGQLAGVVRRRDHGHDRRRGDPNQHGQRHEGEDHQVGDRGDEASGALAFTVGQQGGCDRHEGRADSACGDQLE